LSKSGAVKLNQGFSTTWHPRVCLHKSVQHMQYAAQSIGSVHR
jgi:hypothetical protein